MSRKTKVLSCFVIFWCFLFLIVSLTNGQPSQTTDAKFHVEIYDVNLVEDTGQVNVTITLTNLNTTGIPSTEPVFAVITDGFDTMQINCTKDFNGDYAGSSGIVSWDLGGELGKGQYFPFERYELTFQLVNVLPLLPNMSLFATSKDSHAYFEGNKKVVLSQTFKSNPTNAGPIVEMPISSGPPSATVYLSRNENSSIIWLLIAPTIACFFALASTIMVYRKQDISNRLFVYISLLVFGPVFLMAMQNYLPFRTSLSIPEVLIENLIISTVIFSSLTFLLTRNRIQELLRDGLIIFISLLSSSYILNHFEPQFPVAALPVFLLGISPYLLAGFIMLYRVWKYLVALGLDSRHFVIGYFGMWTLGIGFFLAAFYLGGYLSSFDNAMDINWIVSFSVGTIGAILFAWSVGLGRTRTRRFNDGVV